MRRKGRAGFQGSLPRFHFFDIYANRGGVLDPSNIGVSITGVLVGDQQANVGERTLHAMGCHVHLRAFG